MSTSKIVMLGLASAITIAAAAPSFAAPVLSSTAIVKDSAPAQTTEIRWRRGGAVAAGAAAGFLAGAVIGSAIAGPQYYGYGYGYDAYYVEPGYAYQPVPVYGGYAYESYGYQPAPRYYRNRTNLCNGVMNGSSDSSNC